jgi:GT2 family glycosyltransferase
MTQMQPSADIIILNYNTWRHTIECLESVLRSDYSQFRVIISDNRSTDDSLERIRAWLSGSENPVDAAAIDRPMRDHVSPPVPKPVAFVEGDVGTSLDTTGARVVILRGARNAGFAGGNNAALELSLAEGRAAFAWILNNDTVVAPDCLSRLVDVMSSDERIGGVGATILEYRAPSVVQIAGGGRISPATGAVRDDQAGVSLSALDRDSWRFDYVSCCSLLVRRETLESIGLLDEHFFIYSEDSDFGLRMSRAKWKLAYAPDALLWHKGSATSVSGSAFSDYHQLRGCLLLVYKWRPWLVPAAFVFWLYGALAPKLWRRQWPRARAVCRAFADVLREMLPAA